jgi:hypothetical protein
MEKSFLSLQLMFFEHVWKKFILSKNIIIVKKKIQDYSETLSLGVTESAQ